MEGEKILMSQRQLQRLAMMGLVEAGKITLEEGAEKIGMSYRQTKRIRKKVREKGARGVIRGNTGKLLLFFDTYGKRTNADASLFQYNDASLLKGMCHIRKIGQQQFDLGLGVALMDSSEQHH